MGIDFIQFRPPKPSTPPRQCDAPFDVKSGWAPHYIERRGKKVTEKGWDIDRCNRVASYQINGACLCTQHAGIEAIRVLKEIKDGS